MEVLEERLGGHRLERIGDPLHHVLGGEEEQDGPDAEDLPAFVALLCHGVLLPFFRNPRPQAGSRHSRMRSRWIEPVERAIESQMVHAEDDERGLLGWRSAVLDAPARATCLDECRERQEPDHLRAVHLDTRRAGERRDPVEGDVGRRRVGVGEVHRDLHASVLLDRPADRLHAGEAAARRADALGDRRRERCVAALERDVERDEDPSGADRERTSGRVRRRWTEVGRPFGLGQLLREPFELAAPHAREVGARRRTRRSSVEDHRHGELGRDARAEIARHGNARVHRHAAERHERAYVEGPHARVRSVVRAHVDLGDARAGESEGCLQHGLGIADEREHASMRAGTRVLVQERHTGRRADGRDEPGDARRIAALGDVGHTLDEGRGHRIPL